jgi:hypothetical protein
MAYAFYRMASDENNRVLPENARHRPSSIEELVQINRDLRNELRSSANEFEITEHIEPDESPSLQLTGAYPNPFNPEISINFALGTSMDVSIELFNIRGQRVRNLLNENLGRGEHRIIWNGTDDSGRSMSSGMYFYRITAGEFQETRRILLMK